MNYFLIGRLLLGGFFLLMGFNHFTKTKMLVSMAKTKMLVSMAKTKKIPSPLIVVLFSGLLLILGGAGIVFNIFVGWAVIALVTFLVPSALLMHNFWSVADDEKMLQMQFFIRNIALTGAVLIVLKAFGI